MELYTELHPWLGCRPWLLRFYPDPIAISAKTFESEDEQFDLLTASFLVPTLL